MQFFFQIISIFVTPIAFPTLISVESLFVTLLIFIHLLCTRHPHDSHNTAFAIVFLPQMSHGSFLLDGFILIYPIILTMTLVFTRFTFRPLLSSAPFKKISSVTSWIPPSKLKKSAYSIPCNVPTLSRSLQPQSQWQTTVVIKPIPRVLQRLPHTLQINVLKIHLCLFTFIQAHRCSNQYSWISFLSHFPINKFPWNFVKWISRSTKHMYNF